MVLNYLSSIKEVFSNDGAFCALKNDGTIKCWGHTDYGGTTPVDISNVKTVYTSNQTFTALTINNTLITWGKTEHGGGTTKVSNKMKKNALLNRMYGTSTSIHNVKKNNLRQKNNYNFNNSSYNRPLKQLLSIDDELFIDTYSQTTLEKINSIKTLINGEITDENLNDIIIINDKQRHVVLDKIFSNVPDVSFNINSSIIGLKEKLTKNKTKVFKSQETINAKTDATSDISTNQSVYGNLSDLSDNITVDMDDSVSFKVTRTTTKGLIGKYNVEVLSGKMVVYGRHTGTIEFGTASLQLGEYQDGDQIIINTHSFFFGGFGCNNLTNTANSDKNYQNIVTTNRAVAYLDSNGKVYCFGFGDFSTIGKNLESGVIKLCATQREFIALKDDGSVVIWGESTQTNIIKKSLHIKHYFNNELNRLYYDYSNQLNDIIDIQSFSQYKEFCILRKKNNSFIIIGDGISGASSVDDSMLDENGNPPIYGVIFENLHQIYIGASDYFNIGYITVVGINNKGKLVNFGKTYTYSTTTKTYTGSGKNQSAVDITDKYYGISGEILSTGSYPNHNGNFYQNYTVDNLPPVSKVFINGSFTTVILNNGTAAWWGVTYVYGPRSGTYEKDNTNIVTTSIFDQLRSRKFVDGVTSTSSTALLDSSGGVILFGISQASYFKSVHPTDIFVDTTNELRNDISANVVKMVATRYETFAFLRNDNVAILVPNVNTDISDNLFPNSYIDSITKKGPAINTKKQTYLIPNIKDIYTGGYAGLGFITMTNDVILWSWDKDYTLIDIGEIVGGKLENVKELFSNGNSWCALKYDNTLVCIKGGIKSINNKIGFVEIMPRAGCDYNDVYFGINGIYSNGGNGKGGCVLNGDGETVLKNVKNVFPVMSNPSYVKSESRILYAGGYIAIIDDGTKESIVYWGNSELSYIYLGINGNNIKYQYNVRDGGMSLLDTSSNLIGKTSSNIIFGIQDTETWSTNNKPHIMKNNKYKYKNAYNFGNSIVIKVTVQVIDGNNKFVLNGDTSSYTFKDGYSYIFDTSDSSNINYKIAVSNSPDISKNENCVQYLIPGDAYSFTRYYKSNKYTYIYCETNGFSMGSLYNPTTTPVEFTALETAFGGTTEKDIISKYVNVPVNKKLLDASLNSITIDTDAKKTAILESLFTTLPTNNIFINREKLGYSNGINNPLTSGVDMKIINITNTLRGMSISGETVLSSAISLNSLLYTESLNVFMGDLSDNVLLNAGSKIGAPSTISSIIPTLITGVEFTIRRITDSSSDARYEISPKYGTLIVNTTASNFNTIDNTGYFVNNDKLEIEGTEIIFETNGFISKGSKKLYTTIIVTVSDSKFLFNNSTTKPGFEYDKNYKFDVSDSSNENYKLRFSNSNSTSIYNSFGYGTSGTSGAFVTFTPGNFTAQSVYVFDSSNNDLNIGSLYNPMPINNGISKTNLDSIESQTIDGGFTLPGTLYSGLIGANDEEKQTQKNLRRHQMLRTLFAVNPKNTTLETTTTNLGFGSEYNKSNFKVFNPLNDTNTVNINVATDTTNTKGFYAGLEDNSIANITLSDGITVLKIERTSTDSNNNGIYYVSNTTVSTEIFVTETNSKTYIIDSNPAGPFKDNDTATINYMPLVFGGIGDGRNINPASNPSAPILTDVFDNTAAIPIIPGNTVGLNVDVAGGFAGIASDGKLYKWGVKSQNTSYLEPGNPDGNSPSASRITDISFCINIAMSILCCKTNGSVSNTSTDGTFDLSNSQNMWYDNGTLSTDLTTIRDVIGIYGVQWGSNDSVGALLLRSDGSVAFWAHNVNYSDSYSLTQTYSYAARDRERYSLRGTYGKRLMDSTDANFSKIIKIVGGYRSVMLLREDGRVAWLRYKEWPNEPPDMGNYDNRVRWGASVSNLPNGIYLSNCLDNDGTTKKYFGKVVDIVAASGAGQYRVVFYLLNDLGQCSAMNNMEREAPIYSTSYDLTSTTFKKTMKMFTTKTNFLQIKEGFCGIVPEYLYKNTYNQNSTIEYDILDGGLHSTNNGVKRYNASKNDGYISKYYGEFVLMSNGYIRPIKNTQYNDWNDPVYGIHGTSWGSQSGREAYGDLKNVKELHTGNRTWHALLNDNTVVSWGKSTANALEPGGWVSYNISTADISNQLIDVKKILVNEESGAAVLKYDGSLVVWGVPEHGGSTTGYAFTPNMSDNTFSSGILDIFCSSYTFTAVKSDGVLVWGKTAPSSQLDQLDGVSWSKNTLVMNTTYAKESNHNYMYLINNYDPNKTTGQFLYNTTVDITSKINELLTEGVSQANIVSVVAYPDYIPNYENLIIPTTFFSSGTKDTIRKLLIELLFLMKPKVSKIENMNTSLFSLDTKINKDNITILKSNLGAIDLSMFNNYYDGYYVSLNDTNTINFKSIEGDIVFQIKRSGTNYVLEKQYGSGVISANNLGPFTSGKLEINNSIIKFLDGVYDGSEIVSQKYNCIATTYGAAAYLTKTGKVITWGMSNNGGYSHEEFDLQPSTPSYSISSYQVNVSTDAKSKIVEIVSAYNAFSALKADGSVVSWGHQSYGGKQNNNNSKIEGLLTSGVKKLYSNSYAFCAVKNDGTIVCWGHQSYGGNSALNNSGGEPKDIVKIFSHTYGFIGLKSDKSIVTWGNAESKIDHVNYGVNGSYNNNTTALTTLTNILEVYINSLKKIYIAIKTDGSIVRWGYNTNTYMSTDLQDRFNKEGIYTNAPSFVNAYSSGDGIYPVDASGGVYVISDVNTNYTLWDAVKTDISENVTRVVTNGTSDSAHGVIACLINDNKLIVFGTRGSYKSYGGDFNSTDTAVTSYAHLPPSDYIVNNNTLKNIKDIFPGESGFAAIDISDNVLCWGYKNSYYVNDIDYTKIYGGDLSGNDISENRPIALFNNGRSWACLKEDETVITWDGTNTTNAPRGSKHIDTTYGVNATYWGGNNGGGAIRNGDGTNNTLGYIKNIIPYGDDNYCGFIAIGEDISSNNFCVSWGGDNNTSRWTYTTPNTAGRAFRHIVDKLTSHSKYQLGIFNNRGNFDSFRNTAHENLHEFDFGNQAFTGNETGFGSAVTKEETYDVESIDADASANGVPSETIDKFKNSKLNEDVDETEVFAAESSIFQNTIVTSGKTKREIRKQRHTILKLAFANNSTRTKFKTTAASLGYVNLAKTNIMVIKINFGKAEINLKEEKNLDDNTGFLIPIEDGQEATITNKEGTSKFTIKRDEVSFGDEDGKYYVETVEQISMITNFESSTYIRGSSPQGPFKDGDRAVIAGVPILFGGLTEDDGNYSFGDPYVNPIFGSVTKLPDEKALYRLFQGLDVYINCSVDKISEKKQKIMEDWFYKKTGFDSKLFGFITSGFFYNKIYITSEKHELFCDFDKQSMTMDEKDKEYFTIVNTYGIEKDNSFILNEKCSIYTISWPHKEYNNIEFTIKIYENPQIDNAVSIQVAGNIIDCKGLMVRNYKPSLMRISDIKIKKDKKLNKRLKKAKHKFDTKAIKDKDEVWVKVKGT